MIKNNCESYKVFCTVARYGNITAGANELFLAQSTVSRIIQGLENTLGCNLLNRTIKGVSLTEEGHFLYERLSVLFSQIETAEAEFERQFTSGKYVISLGASELTLEHFLFPYITKFRDENPSIEFRTDYAYPKDAVERLINGELDIAVLGTPLEDSEFVEYRNLAEIDFILAAGSKFSWLKEKLVSLKSLETLPFVTMSDDTSVRKYAERMFTSSGMKIKYECAVGAMPLYLKLIRDSVGIGFMPALSLQSSPYKGEVFEVNLERGLPKEHICMMIKRNAPKTSPGRKFAEMLTKQI